MAHTNQTPNYELSQFLGTDKPAWLVDYNGDMEKIDLGLKATKDVADAAKAEADQGAIDIAAVTITANSADAKASGAVSDLSDAYDSTSTYNIGDYVIYNSILYRCIVAISVPESFDGNHWVRTTVEEITTQINSNLSNVNTDIGFLNGGLKIDGVSSIIETKYINNQSELNKTFMCFNCNSIVPLFGSDGTTQVTSMPRYSKGIFIATDNSTNSDGLLIYSDANANTYAVTRNGTYWNQIKKLSD